MSLYNHTTRLQFKEDLTASLGDPSKKYWTDTEEDSLLEEAFLTFCAISGFCKARIFLNTVVDQTLYNLIEDADINQDKISFDYTYQIILDWFNRDVEESISVENPTSIVTTLAELFGFIEDRIDQYNHLTSLVLAVKEYPITPDNSLVTLDDNVLDIVRIEFLDETGIPTLLYKDDEEQLSYSKDESLNEQGPPEFFTEIFLSTKDIRIYPRPNVPGTLRVIYVLGVDRTIPASIDKIINLPNNLIPYIKWGVLKDIFQKDGLIEDEARATYCNQRWEEGIQVGRFYTSALRGMLNDRAILLDSLNKIDQCSDMDSGKPTIIGFAGYNLFGTDLIPDDIYALAFDSNVNAIIPANDSDFLQMKIEYLPYISNYCNHLAQFKSGSADLKPSIMNMQAFLKIALQHNKRLVLEGFTYEQLVGKTKQQELEENRIVREAS